jgi:hypothetical protein
VHNRVIGRPNPYLTGRRHDRNRPPNIRGFTVPNKGRTLQAYQVPSQMPSELNAFLEPSPVLPDEDLKDYEFIKQMMIEDISPQTTWNGFGRSILWNCPGK